MDQGSDNIEQEVSLEIQQDILENSISTSLYNLGYKRLPTTQNCQLYVKRLNNFDNIPGCLTVFSEFRVFYDELERINDTLILPIQITLNVRQSNKLMTDSTIQSIHNLEASKVHWNTVYNDFNRVVKMVLSVNGLILSRDIALKTEPFEYNHGVYNFIKEENGVDTRNFIAYYLISVDAKYMLTL